jgi:hypothetical protein
MLIMLDRASHGALRVIDHNDWDISSPAWVLHTTLPMMGIVFPLGQS